MRVGTLTEAWEAYSAQFDRPFAPPPHGIFVFEGEQLVAGCCIYPGEGGMMGVTRVKGYPTALQYLFRVLRVHERATSSYAMIDMTDTMGSLDAYPLDPAGMWMLGDEVERPGDDPPQSAAEPPPAPPVDEGPPRAAPKKSDPKKPKKSKPRKKRVRVGKVKK